MTSSRPTILTFADYYLPGYRAGGPIQTLANMVAQLSDDYEFRVVTRDHDHLEPPYSGVEAGAWNTVGRGLVRYLSAPELSPRGIHRLISETDHDVLYLNSFLSPRASLTPRLVHRFLGARAPVVVAPRGELAPAALALKPRKKAAYIRAMRLSGLHRETLWHASTAIEAEDVRRVFPGARVHVARDLGPAPGPPGDVSSRKEPGLLRAAFLSRVVPIKNLAFALEALAMVRGPVVLDVYGPLEDDAYVARCRERAAGLPDRVRVTFHGTLPHPRVRAMFRDHDVLLLPTLGENYGHVIVECFAAGRPVVVSDRTSWRGLRARGVGRDLTVDDASVWAREIDELVEMDRARHLALCRAADAYAREILEDPETLRANREVFAKALGGF